jgi:glycosyltransferase involved in cell wall biosynthesis
MCWEQKAARVLGKNLKVSIFCPKNTYPDSDIIVFSKNSIATNLFQKFYNWFYLRKEFYNWLLMESKNYDIILLRYSVHDPFLLDFLNKVKIPVYLVHHTLELPELDSLGFFGKFRCKLDKLIGNHCISKSSGLIGVTKEIIGFEQSRIENKKKNVLIYPNGIFLEQKKLNDHKLDVPEFLFVASYFFDWHGLDLLLSNLKNTDKNFVLHVVGEVQNKDIELAYNDERVIFHGKLVSSEINNLAKSCWVGLSSFALYRKGMQEACTLKVREYLSLGLPVYSGHQDVFPDEFIFYKKGLPNFDSILEFGNHVKNFSKQQVLDCAESYISKVELLDNLISQFEILHDSRDDHD